MRGSPHSHEGIGISLTCSPSCFPMARPARGEHYLEMAAPPTITENGALFLAQQQMRKREERPPRLRRIILAVRAFIQSLAALMSRRKKNPSAS